MVARSASFENVISLPLPQAFFSLNSSRRVLLMGQIMSYREHQG